MKISHTLANPASYYATEGSMHIKMYITCTYTHTYLIKQSQIIFIVVVHEIHDTTAVAGTVFPAVLPGPVQPTVPLLHPALGRSLGLLGRHGIQVHRADPAATQDIGDQVWLWGCILNHYPQQTRNVHYCVAQRHQVYFLCQSLVSGCYGDDGGEVGSISAAIGVGVGRWVCTCDQLIWNDGVVGDQWRHRVVVNNHFGKCCMDTRKNFHVAWVANSHREI